MKKLSRFFLSLFILHLSFFGVEAQGIDSIRNSFTAYSEGSIKEKIFVHTDKAYYLAGEVIWFKVYDVEASLNKPLGMSKVAYVEVLSGDNSPLLQTKIALKNGVGSGSLYVPVTASNGTYKLRSYTNWMKNFSPDFYFSKQITIINSLFSPVRIPKDTIPELYDIRFFPEGGHLVNGIQSSVAFKAVNQRGIGISLTGYIVNGHSDTVARFESLQFGMGHFLFTPVAKDSYRAIIRLKGGQTLIRSLPDISDYGYVIKVTETESEQPILTINSNLIGQQSDQLYLFIHSGQFVKMTQIVSLHNGEAQLKIDKENLGDGLSRLTLFDGNARPVCERLIFKRPKRLLVTINTDQKLYGNRKKVELQISTKISANPVMADLSVSVYRLDSLKTGPQVNIESYLWLSSELKGYIESPDYYLMNNNRESDEALDNLMMTQGWSRFGWADILKKSAPSFKFIPEYAGHIVTAKVSDQKGNPVPNAYSYLGVTGQRARVLAAQSDGSGQLLFDSGNLSGRNELVIESISERDSLDHYRLISPYSDQFVPNHVDYPQLNGELRKSLEMHSVDMQIQNIFYPGRLSSHNMDLRDSSAFYGKAKTYLLDQYTRFTTMEEVLREYVAEVNLVHKNGKLNIKIIEGDDYLSDEPLLLVDGIPVLNADKIINLDPLSVKKLEVIPKTYHLGGTTHGGILSFTTYKGHLGVNLVDKHAFIVDYEGLQNQREFYSPVYEPDNGQKKRMPDFRNLLYWSPVVNTNRDGDSRLSFYTSDEAGNYVIVVQGMDKNGHAGSGYFTVDVKD